MMSQYEQEVVSWYTKQLDKQWFNKTREFTIRNLSPGLQQWPIVTMLWTVISNHFIAPALICKMWADAFLKYFGHVTAITVKSIRHRPTRLAILLSVLGLLVLGVTSSVTYLRDNFTSSFGPDVVYSHYNGSTPLEGVSFSPWILWVSHQPTSRLSCKIPHTQMLVTCVTLMYGSLAWQPFGPSM